MVEFAGYIEDNWELPYEVAEEICTLYTEGNSKYFVRNYVPTVSAFVTTDILSEIYRFLRKQEELVTLRDRARSVLEKAELLDEENEEKIIYSISEAEIEDVYIGHRTNVRTKGRVALERGLQPLADQIHRGECTDFDAAAQEYLRPDEELKSTDDVRKGVVDILAERYGFDEEVRIMLRDFAEDEGMVSLHFKKKAKKKYDKYTDENMLFSDLESKEILDLRKDEEAGDIKVKVALPPIHVMELMKEHFWEDAAPEEDQLIMESLEDAWNRLIYPMVETSVKDHYYEQAENELIKEMKRDLRPMVEEYAKSTKKTLLFASAYSEDALDILVVDSLGSMLRCTRETIRQYGRPFVSKKIKQLFTLYHPNRIAVLNNDHGEYVESVIDQTSKVTVSKPEVERVPLTTKTSALMKSAYFIEETEGLSEEISKNLAYALSVMKPFAVISKVGAHCFSIHPQEKLLDCSVIGELIDDLYVAAALEYGIQINGANDYLLTSLELDESQLRELRRAKQQKRISSKQDLKDLDCLDAVQYNNISGYIVFPESDNPLDKSTVHPEEFGLVQSVCDELGVTPEKLIRTTALLQDFHADDSRVEDFIQQNIANQLKVAKRYISLSSKPARPLRINELREGAILDGKVTNITNFGAFVDINSYSDGLVHISELANEYIETPDQVVSVGDPVRVKVVEVDKRKKRISLSMKQVENAPRKVRPSQTQLEDLVSFFNK
ncbi:S1 RNA-binding domain-containing protein [Chitinivibrio alkaliphilus]|uniref:Tex-like protein n=1 Tax=Chitinivibrio alkaliphilus ACht1 TaxID=1313304 RepID=U7DAV7_9BACT|nr:S1 RNA-binding domain-containing protein [Chitinivibrio alkaliphilus]ERP31535.1 Tex-like protein [Chitinivibrio alkaliphilus ACht1]